MTELKALSVYDTRYKKTRTYGNKVYTNMPKDGGECESFTTVSANIFNKYFYFTCGNSVISSSTIGYTLCYFI